MGHFWRAGMFPYVLTHRQFYIHIVPSVQALAPTHHLNSECKPLHVPKCLASHVSVPDSVPGSRRLFTENITIWVSITSAFPAFLQGSPRSATQSLTSKRTFFFFFWWDTGSLFSEFRLIQAPGKLSSKATRSQTGRTDTGFSYASCFPSITDCDHSSPLQCAQEVYLGSAFWCPSCYTAYWLLQYGKCSLRSNFLRMKHKLIITAFLHTELYFYLWYTLPNYVFVLEGFFFSTVLLGMLFLKFILSFSYMDVFNFVSQWNSVCASRDFNPKKHLLDMTFPDVTSHTSMSFLKLGQYLWTEEQPFS